MKKIVRTREKLINKGKFVVSWLDLSHRKPHYEVSVHINKQKGLIRRKPYQGKQSSLNAYRNISSLESIKRWVGKDYERLYKGAMA